MKNILFLITALIISLNPVQAELVGDQIGTFLEEVDNHCGDTWCEGEFDFDFKYYEQTDKELIISFHVLVWANDLESFTGYPRECRFEGNYQFSDLLERNDYYYSRTSIIKYRLTQAFADQMNGCIRKIEQEFF